MFYWINPFPQFSRGGDIATYIYRRSSMDSEMEVFPFSISFCTKTLSQDPYLFARLEDRTKYVRHTLNFYMSIYDRYVFVIQLAFLYKHAPIPSSPFFYENGARAYWSYHDISFLFRSKGLKISSRVITSEFFGGNGWIIRRDFESKGFFCDAFRQYIERGYKLFDRAHFSLVWKRGYISRCTRNRRTDCWAPSGTRYQQKKTHQESQ